MAGNVKVSALHEKKTKEGKRVHEGFIKVLAGLMCRSAS